MQVPGLVVPRVCSSDRTAVFAGVREQIVHLLFTTIVVQLLGGHPTPQVTDLYSRLPFGIGVESGKHTVVGYFENQAVGLSN